MLATVAGVMVLPVRRTCHYYINGNFVKCRALEEGGAEALFFWHKVRGTAAAVAICCALRVTSTNVGVTISFVTVWPVNIIYECILYRLSVL
jgi:hypothetical protein